MQGLYIAAAAALVTAVAEDKVKEIANICAELMRLGWVKLVSVLLMHHHCLSSAELDCHATSSA